MSEPGGHEPTGAPLYNPVLAKMEPHGFRCALTPRSPEDTAHITLAVVAAGASAVVLGTLVALHPLWTLGRLPGPFDVAAGLVAGSAALGVALIIARATDRQHLPSIRVVAHRGTLEIHRGDQLLGKTQRIPLSELEACRLEPGALILQTLEATPVRLPAEGNDPRDLEWVQQAIWACMRHARAGGAPSEPPPELLGLERARTGPRTPPLDGA